MGNKNIQIGYNSPIAIHPGETIKDALLDVSMTQADLAVRTNLSEKTISQILNGKEPVTVETALKIERALGLNQNLLVGMQGRYEADYARIKEKEKLEKEVGYLEKYSCYKEIADLGYVKKVSDPLEKVSELLNFFGVNSLSSVRVTMPVAFRKNDNGNISYESIAAWLRMGDIQSKKREVKSFNKDKLIKNIPKMRSLTKERAEIFSDFLIELCAEVGVCLVYTPHLMNTKINGASRWISPDKALVQISLFNKYSDIFWFTFFHEIGHLLKHSKKESFIDYEKGSSALKREEAEADLFSQTVLIPDKEEFESFKKELNNRNIREKILSYSKKIDIDPGIVAGRVGREMDAWNLVSSLRTRLRFD